MTPHICNHSCCVSIGWLQTNSNEQALPSPPPAHTPAVLQVCTHKLCLTVQVLTGRGKWFLRHQRSKSTPLSAQTFLILASCSWDAPRRSKLSPRWPVGRSSSTAASPASAEISHTTHPCFGSNSCRALPDFLSHWKTVLPLLVHLKKIIISF